MAIAVVIGTLLLRADAPPARIVSLVPAVTEILFAIGAGPQVAGVSSFDSEPPEVARLPRVGALVDPDLERILSLRPDLVVVYGTQADLRTQLDRAAVPAFAYEHAGLADVSRTILALGARTGHADAARALVQRVDRDLEAVRTRVAGRARPRVLLVLEREPGSLRNIFASGGVGFLHDMLELAGGANVFADVKRQAVQATTEQILVRAPDVILEISAQQAPGAAGDRAWDRLPSVPAVRDRRVIRLTGSDLVVPGPRIARGAERIAAALHPE